MLNIIDCIPEGLPGLAANELHRVLPGPTLLHLRGQRPEPVFVSVLLHGNEHTGWEVLRGLLSEYRDRELPRSLSVFIGNIEAARYNKRYLDQQPDYNRIWCDGETPEHKMMLRVVDEMKHRKAFLSIDIHNNTGRNPHYACVNNTYSRYLQIARLFSRTVVYFIRPKGVQSMAFAEFCPAVTVECGASGEPDGVKHAGEFVRTCLGLEKIPDHTLNNREIDLYHTVGIVKILPDIRFGFDHGDADLLLEKKIETSNFRELPGGTVFGQVRDGMDQVLEILDEQGNEVHEQYFSIENGCLRSRRSIVPAMITVNEEAIRKDCFFYIMEHYPL
ncbi:MAG: M14 family metallopeptidase [Gammaproteobacteria bacterium]|nr:M14 family metallopeptidase [Gammaproteobacteria bacterium]